MPLSVPSYWRLTYRRQKGERLAPFHQRLADFVRSQWGCLDSLSAALPAALPGLMHTDCGAGELCFSSALQPNLDDFADDGVADDVTWDEPWCSSQCRTGAVYQVEQGNGFLFSSKCSPSEKISLGKALGLMQLAAVCMYLCFKVNYSFLLPSVKKRDWEDWESWGKSYLELCG